MKYLMATIICASMAITGCSGKTNNINRASDSTALAESATLLIGSYSEPGDSALRAYRFNPADGSAEYLYSMPVANASFFTQAPSGIVYAVCESDEAASTVTALRPDADGAEVLNVKPVGSSSPCYISVSPDGQFVLTANYGGGTVAVFPIKPDGALGDRRMLIPFEGSGPVERRQQSSHPHCIAFTPDNLHMLVDDLGTDRINIFNVREGDYSPVAGTPDTVINIKPGSGPRHIVFNPKGDIAYLINEISDEVTVLRYDGYTLTPAQYIAADTAGAHGAGDIHLSADGLHLYASLRLKHEGIATFDVDRHTGLLTWRSHTPTGGHPRNFTLSPDGRYMLVACRDAGAVQIFAVDPHSGTLSDTGRRIDVPRPVCVRFLK